MNENETTAFNQEELNTCLRVLETLVKERTNLAHLTKEERKSLLIAAGRFSRPEKMEMWKVARGFRKLRKKAVRDRDAVVRNETGIRRQREAAEYVPAPRLPSGPSEVRYLETPAACYVCKIPYSEIHFFYDSMCPDCATLSYEKRFQTADLWGKTALVTGSRVKIGFHTGLKLLRAGATVIATTRFPKDSARRYSQEADFEDWKDRLHIYGLDLRHSPSVEIFCGYISRNYERLDVLINNAAQTVRRPPGFYRHLMPGETSPLTDPRQQALLAGFEDCKRTLAGQLSVKPADSALLTSGSAFQRAAVGLQDSPSLSQIPYAYDDETNAGLEIFPEGTVDADLQQVDLRTMNSWRLKLGEVATPEMLEVHLVNAVAPFILCGKLRGLMQRTPGREKHIVNVSAMEGKFTRYTKTDKHPHTNMAKAALNMMTVTSAPDYAKDGIFMNAVDTGWVTDEDPVVLAQRKAEEHNFQPPLDIVDGASRNVDPVFHGLNTGDHQYGYFFKDYKPTEW